MPYSEETYFKALRLEIVILQDTLQDRLELARDAHSALSAGTVAPEKQDIERKRVADWLADARRGGATLKTHSMPVSFNFLASGGTGTFHLDP